MPRSHLNPKPTPFKVQAIPWKRWVDADRKFERATLFTVKKPRKRKWLGSSYSKKEAIALARKWNREDVREWKALKRAKRKLRHPRTR